MFVEEGFLHKDEERKMMYVTNQISSQQGRLHYTIYIQYHAYAVRSV